MNVVKSVCGLLIKMYEILSNEQYYKKLHTW